MSEEEMKQFQAIQQALGEALAQCRALSRALGPGEPGRALAIAATNTEQAALWLRRAFEIRASISWGHAFDVLVEVDEELQRRQPPQNQEPQGG